MTRDMDKQPYSADEKRVAQFFFDMGLGGGDDPIGFIIASHQAMAAERNGVRDELDRTRRAQSFVFGKRELITDMERQLLVVLVTKAWVEIKDDKEMDVQAQELLSILRKITGVDKRIEVSS